MRIEAQIRDYCNSSDSGRISALPVMSPASNGNTSDLCGMCDGYRRTQAAEMRSVSADYSDRSGRV
jgi:hypothetical protein